MSEHAIHLILSYPSLRQAVAEQLRLARYSVTGEDAAAPPVGASAIIVDAQAKLPGTLVTQCVLRIGEASEDDAQAMVTESFATPLRLGHLLARLEYHLTVAPRLRVAPLTLGPYCFQPQSRQLTVSNDAIVVRLTEKESALLEFIATALQPVTRDEILAAIWGYDSRIDTHTLETHIYQLRRKLETDPRGAGLLVNEQGAYRLQPGAA